MIFFQILIFIVSITFLALSISGYGRLVNLSIQKNFFLDIFLGLILISLIITIIHFFLKINVLISVLIFSLGILFFFYKKKISALKFFRGESINYLLIILLLIPIFLSQKYHEDFGYYHLPYAIGFIEEKIIFGFANIDKSYVYNSIWLNLYSIFFLNDKNFNFLTLPSFIIYFVFILFSFNQITSKRKITLSNYYLIVSLFYFLLKFTRISEFGVDLPAIIFSILSIFYFIKFFEIEKVEEKKNYFFLITTFSIFSILIKLSTLPIIILSLYLYVRYFKNLKLCITKPRYFLIYFLFVSFIIQQFIYTGCIFFPTEVTCLKVDWFNSDYLQLSKQLELVNKSYYHNANNFYTPQEYLSNFNWISFWFKRNFVEISEHLLTIILPTLFFLYFLKKSQEHKIYFKEKLILYIFLLFGFLFWFSFSPVYRFGIHLFLTLVFMVLIYFFTLKKFSKKIFIIFVLIFLFFNFSKNILRLNKVDDIFFGIQKINNEYIYNAEYSNEFAKIFRPDLEKNSKNGWQGRLCWDTPFICSYNNLNIYKTNNYLFLKY